MDYYNEIKNELIENEITKRVKDYGKNKSDLTHYYNVGKLIVEAQGGEARAKYGDGLIKEYSRRLSLELGRGYSERNLKNMRRLFLFCEKGHAMRAELSWTHYRELFRIKDDSEINYYISICISNRLTYRELLTRIKNNEYSRLSISYKNKIIRREEVLLSDLIKNPIIIRNSLNINEISEKYLKKIIIDDVETFMRELGDGYSYIGSEYKIRIGNNYNYIDLLLFNYKYNCFVVVELKITELKKEHIGQIEVYMNYIDKHVKEIHHDKTIGIILCKHDNKLIMEYSSDVRIISREYVLM